MLLLARRSWCEVIVIDGLWSACGGERIIIFTTNHKEKLDPALVRRGRMDKHIEMSYCGFEAFKVLAGNYLDITDHELFGEIRRLLGEVNMTPADVAENLMPMSKKKKKRDNNACLEGLVEALNKAKQEAKAKAEAEDKEAKEEAEAKKGQGGDQDQDQGKEDKTSESTEGKMSNGEIKGSEQVTSDN